MHTIRHTMLALGLCLTALAAHAGPNLVSNGDFENALNSWTTGGGEPGYQLVVGQDVTGSPLHNTTTVFADFNVAVMGLLSQDIATLIGSKYTLSFDLQRWGDPALAPDNRAQVMFGNTIVFDQTNVTADWMHFSFSGLLASGTTTTIQFGNYNNDPTWWNQLDNISLVLEDVGPPNPVPEPASMALLAAGRAALGARRRISRA